MSTAVEMMYRQREAMRSPAFMRFRDRLLKLHNEHMARIARLMCRRQPRTDDMAQMVEDIARAQEDFR